MKKIIVIILLIGLAFVIVSSTKSEPKQALEGLEGLIEALVVEKDLPKDTKLVPLERIQNASKTYTAITIGPVGGDAVGFMVLEGESIIKRSYIAQGDWRYLSIKNIIWERENSLSFEEVATLDGKSESVKKNLTVR
jgi:hypothetical protein